MRKLYRVSPDQHLTENAMRRDALFLVVCGCAADYDVLKIESSSSA